MEWGSSEWSQACAFVESKLLQFHFGDLHIEFHHISFNNDDCLNSQWASADHGSDQWCPVSWQAGHCLTHKWQYAKQGKDTTPMFGCVAVCPHFASPQSSGILPQHIKMAQSWSQWVLQTKIFVVGQTYHTYNACFQDLSSMNPSTFPQRGPRQHCWAPRASCGGALCRLGRGNRGQSVGLWSCRWSCDYLACTLVTGNSFFQIDGMMFLRVY